MRVSSAPAGWQYTQQSKDGGYLFRSELIPGSGPYDNVTTADFRTAKAKAPAAVTQTNLEQGPERAAPGILHAVYSDLLNLLPLYRRHKEQLTDPTGPRRLSEVEVKALGVKSVPDYSLNRDICARLEATHGRARLLTVPGFYLNPKGVITLAAGPGMLLPAFNILHNITGLQVRSDQAGKGEDIPRYYWLSSAKHDDGPGARPLAGLYQPLNGIKQPGVIGITEGPFKAFIAAQKLGYPFISTPGTGSWQAAGVVELARSIAPAAIIFYDSELNPATAMHRGRLADVFLLAGMRVDIAAWPLDYKGIDDLLIAGQGQDFTRSRHVLGLAGVKVDRVINEQYLSDSSIKPRLKVTLIRSYKGSGKTEAISRLIGGLGSKADSVLAIGHRVALLGELARRWGLEFYNDYKGTGKGKKGSWGIDRKGLTSAARLAICLDSLVHFDQAGKKNYLIIDEIEQVLKHSTGTTIKDRRRAVVAMLRALILRADYVIGLDADLSGTTYNYFSRLVGPDNIETIVNEYVPAGRAPLWQYDSEPALFAALFDRVRAGVKCYVPTNSQGEAVKQEAALRKEFPELRVLCVTQDNSAAPEIRQVINNLNLYAPEIDVLIASPSLGTGIDISAKHFTHTFIHGVHNSTNHLDLLQHMARNRPAERIHAWIAPGERFAPTGAEYWQQQCIKKHQDTGLAIDYSLETGELIADPGNIEYLKLWADIKAADMASHNNLAGNFYEAARREGYTVQPAGAAAAASQEAIQAAHTRRKDAAEEIEAERQAGILAAPDISEQEAGQLEARAYLPKPARARLERHRIKQFYNLPVEAELIRLDNKGRTMQRLNEFMMLTGQIDPVERDLAIAKDKEKLMPDARHYTRRTRLRFEALAAAVTCKDDWLNHPITGADLVDTGFVDWALENKERLYSVLGLTVKSDIADRPVELLSAILSQLNLKLKCHSRKGKRGQQEASYIVDRASLGMMHRLASARQAVIDRDKGPALAGAA
jgi:hypothetical protein